LGFDVHGVVVGYRGAISKSSTFHTIPISLPLSLFPTIPAGNFASCIFSRLQAMHAHSPSSSIEHAYTHSHSYSKKSDRKELDKNQKYWESSESRGGGTAIARWGIVKPKLFIPMQETKRSSMANCNSAFPITYWLQCLEMVLWRREEKRLEPQDLPRNAVDDKVAVVVKKYIQLEKWRIEIRLVDEAAQP
jgi:hypothetical protein